MITANPYKNICILSPEQFSKVLAIRKGRETALKFDSILYQTKRKNFLDWLSVENFNIEVREIYRNVEGKWGKYQFLNKFHNTRKKINSETCAEIDNLDFEKALTLICEICQKLIHEGYHFAVFYAKGQRSPHIRIYDFDELNELNPMQREKMQVHFWRSLIPWGFHHLDKGMFLDEHDYPLEFSPHWKYGEVFDLLFEWIPKNAKNKS